MAATILTDETVVLENVPDLLDVFTMRSLLNHIGMEVDELRKGFSSSDSEI